MVILLIIFAVTIAASLTVVIMTQHYCNNDWDSSEILFVYFMVFVPFVNLIHVWYGLPELIRNFKDRDKILLEKKLEKDIKNEQDAYDILRRVDVKYIERYLRKKKLSKFEKRR